ncbi:MAG TPA: asparagine synthase (glutamine-hydrolyzing) [Candidatus Paceibacterota bacterium]|nr:asparagine synthase (glutamine-hydrolyzing) [Candidatus Paceibacterota bacterium]
MCGILGLSEGDEPLVRKAASTISYRGPDASGVYTDGEVTLGHNRLSVIDLDPRSNQPFFDPEGKVGLVYNGEIYNYRSIKTELERTGKYVFRTNSDTEVVLYAYKEWKEKVVNHLEGMYAFAVYDRERQQIILCTDQAAIKPLVYANIQGVLAFGSEVKAVVAMLREKNISIHVDQDALSLYYAVGYIPAPATLYQEVRRLRPRTWGVFDLKTHTFTETQYALPLVSAQSQEGMRALIEKSVEQHLVADVPVGLFFSGGTDSSLIAAVLKKFGVQLEAFCVEIADRPEDAQYAQKISIELGMSLHNFTFGPKEFDDIYESIVSRLDEPLADSSLFPTCFVAQKAAEKVKVVLSGEGGDEFFFGYPRSRYLQKLHGAPLDSEAGLFERIFFLLPIFKGKNKLFERIFILMRKPVAFYLLTMSPTKSRMSFLMWKGAKRTLAALAQNADALDADTYLPYDLLRKTDIATMYASLEGRVPLLAPEVISAARATPQHLGTGELKPLLKKILASYIPADLVYRKKTGFGLRARSFFSQSAHVRADLENAKSYLSSRGYLPIDVPREEDMLAHYPNLCWQLISLYHVLRNAGI